MYEEKTKVAKINGDEIILKTGKLAMRADSAVWAQVGETVVLAVVTVGKEETELDYFPLGVEYMEKFYAGGLISSSRFLKREMRPSDDAVLKARQIDHSIRSLFPKSFKKPVSVVVTVLSYDEVHDPVILAVTAASCALMNSTAPFAGPSASVMIGVKAGELIPNPPANKVEDLDAEFMVSVRDKSILNIEGWGDEIPEEKMGELLDLAVEKCQPLLQAQVEYQKEAGKAKIEQTEDSVSKELLAKVESEYGERIAKALYDKDIRDAEMKAVKAELVAAEAESENAISKGTADAAVEYIARKVMRAGVLKENKRSSGRQLDEIRELEIEVGILPRVHGSSLFRRGVTQSLTILTLGSTRLAQTLESFEGESERRFMHHYNGPGYSMGEAGRFSYYPGRREIGHGNIGENALRKMIPPVDKFPYTIRVVSEILSQQGSSSMAASCAACLALMDAGVPVKNVVGGISVGLVTADDSLDDYRLLVDMEDVEDFYGDMDFKVTGTDKGVTAIQLDNKLMGVPVPILKDALQKSREARLKIIAAMKAVLPASRESVSKYAPRVKVLKINPAKIGELIGPGGKVIKGILEQAGEGADIDIQDDGTVNITAMSGEQIALAEQLVLDVVAEAEVGKIYTGVVDKIMEYGAFVDVSGAISGLLHVSEMSEQFVKDPHAIVKEGQKIRVKVKSMENGRISFTLKGVAQTE